MKPLNFFIVLLIFFSSCINRDNPVLEGNDIITTDKQVIDKLTLVVAKSLKTKNGNLISGILDEELKKSLPNYPEKIQEIVSGVSLDSQNTLRNTVLDGEVLNGLFTKISKVNSNENNFTYNIPTRGRTYIRLFTLSAAEPYTKYLVSTVYFRKKGEWRLGNFYVGYYSFYGRNAYDLFREVTKHSFNGNHVLAFLYARLMEACIDPANGNLEYNPASDIREEYATTEKKLREITGIPIAVNEVKSNPEIFDLKVKLSHRIPSPLVYYKTSIPLGNRAEIEKENRLVHDQIDRYLPRATTIFDSVYYVAVNEYPNSYREVDHAFFARLAELKEK